MNVQERKYTAKRITEEEEAALARLRARPFVSPAPKDTFEKALRALSSRQLKELVINNIPSGKVLSKAVSCTTGGYHNNYEKGINVAFLLPPRLPDGPVQDLRLVDLIKAREKEIEARKALEDKVRAKARDCRDRAMLGDGSQALQELQNFLSELAGLA